MILFFYGPNSFASRRALRELAETYITKTGSDFGLERVNAAQISAKELAATIAAVPFLATSRLVIVEYLSANKRTAEKIDEVMAEVPATTVVVFYEKDIDKRSHLFKTLSSQAKAQEFAKLTPPQLSNWIKSEVKSLGGEIDQAALSKLIKYVGDDQWRLEQELIKLVNYQTQITAETVYLLVVQTRDESIFDLVEAVTTGQVGPAVQRYQVLLSNGASELYVLSMIQWQLRNLLLAKTSQIANSAQLAKATGMSPFVASKVINGSRHFSLAQLKQAFLAATETEYAIKTGAGKPVELVEVLIYRIGQGLAP